MENTERLEQLLEKTGSTFHYNADDGVWCLAGEDGGLLWETADYEAASEAEAVADAIAYLEAYDDDDRADATWSEDAIGNVINPHGVVMDLGAVINNMDDDLREKLHNDREWGTEAEFCTVYAAAYLARYGEEWELAKPNPVW